MENNIELEQMREQLELLKGKLEKQELVNERLIAESMKHKMSWIKKFVYVELFGLPFVALLWICIKSMLGLSWWNVSVFIIGCILDTWADYSINVKSMRDGDYARNNLIDTVQKLQHMKHSRFIQMLISLPTVVLFMGWTIYEAMQNIPMAEVDFMNHAMHGGMIGGFVGTILGVIVAFYLYRKLQKTNDDVIKDITELQGGITLYHQSHKQINPVCLWDLCYWAISLW